MENELVNKHPLDEIDQTAASTTALDSMTKAMTPHPTLSLSEEVEPLRPSNPSDKRHSPTFSALSETIAEANKLEEERNELQSELETLRIRLDLAKRRLAAHSANVPIASPRHLADVIPAWLSSSTEVITMRSRLEKAAVDESELMALVEELRNRRGALSKAAWKLYPKAFSRG